jgi:hypothetical protein
LKRCLKKRRVFADKQIVNDSIPIEDLLTSLDTNAEEEFYQLVFSGNTGSIRPMWTSVSQRSEEDYWIYNCPFIRFCSRTIALKLPQLQGEGEEE